MSIGWGVLMQTNRFRFSRVDSDSTELPLRLRREPIFTAGRLTTPSHSPSFFTAPTKSSESKRRGYDPPKLQLYEGLFQET